MNLAENANTDRKVAQSTLRPLSQTAVLQEMTTPRIIRLTTYVIGCAVLVFLVWAAITEVKEVARAQGEVVPDGYVRVVQHLGGGILTELNVREGDLVKKGDVLARVDGTGAKEDLLELQARQSALKLQAERLRAFINDRALVFDNGIQRPNKSMYFQQKIFKSMVTARESERRVILGQISQKKQELVILNRKKKTIEARLGSVREVYEMRRQLFKKGLASRLRYLEQKAELDRLGGEGMEIAPQMEHARMKITEYENRLVSLIAQHRDNAFQKLEETESAIAQNQEAIAKLQKRVDRLEIRAPVRGLIKGIRVQTIGAVMSSGQTLMEIVPINEKLVAEVRIAPSEIGHVKVGQPVRVKVTSYDFARYGAIDGVLESISAATFSGDQGGSFYMGRISLLQDHLGNDRTRNRVSPGMIVQADIITGGKSIIAYLLKPIHVSLNFAFTER